MLCPVLLAANAQSFTALMHSFLFFLFLQYQLQKGSIWRFLFCQWQNWIFFFMALAVMAIIPFAVYQMMVAFKNPPPSTVFHAAAICFGVLTETLLIKWVQAQPSPSFPCKEPDGERFRLSSTWKVPTRFTHHIKWQVVEARNCYTSVAGCH